MLDIKILKQFSIYIVLFTFIVVGVFHQQTNDNAFSFNLLDVGQGDSVLITTTEDIRILIDGGPGDNILRQLPKFLPFASKRIDLVINTHPDSDHLNGLIEVLEDYNVGLVVSTNTLKDTEVYRTFLKKITDKNIKTVELYWGDKIILGDKVELNIIWPPPDLISTEINEKSIVGHLSVEGYTFLLTGDIGIISERQILENIEQKYIKADVLKVPHHGSKYSSSKIMLSTVNPRISLISVGENTYGHPAKEVLDRLNEINSRIFRTDLMENISLRINNNTLILSQN